jgi:hypothetical protein
MTAAYQSCVPLQARAAGCLWGSIDAGHKRPYEHLKTPISKKLTPQKLSLVSS